MTDKNSRKIDVDEELPADAQITNNNTNYPPKLKRPYDKILTDLSEEDLKSPGVYKLILSKSSELEYENYELKKNDLKHRNLEVAHASVSAELTHLKSSKKAVDLLFSASLGTGTCLIGLAFSISSAGANLGGWVVAGVGLILSGIAVAVILPGRKN